MQQEEVEGKQRKKKADRGTEGQGYENAIDGTARVNRELIVKEMEQPPIDRENLRTGSNLDMLLRMAIRGTPSGETEGRGNGSRI
jgi:hypothetical protein